MIRALMLISLFLTIQPSVAQERANYVAVPAVPTTSSVTALQTGLIVFDLSSNSFKGLNEYGNWDTLSLHFSESNIVLSDGSERLNRALIAGPCSSSPCSVTSQSGTWISSMTRSATGVYVINFQSGTYSAAPSCTLTGNQFCALTGGNLNSLSVSCFGVSGGTLIASDLNNGQLICVGPR